MGNSSNSVHTGMDQLKGWAKAGDFVQLHVTEIPLGRKPIPAVAPAALQSLWEGLRGAAPQKHPATQMCSLQILLIRLDPAKPSSFFPEF